MNTTTDVEAMVRRILAEQLGQNVADITLDTKLKDLGAYSLDRVGIIMALEEDFDIKISDEEGEKLLTVQQIVDLVRLKKQMTCAHYWIPNSGQGGDPVFRTNRMMSTEPTMHVMCSTCKTRTWFTEKQWNAIPATLPPEDFRG